MPLYHIQDMDRPMWVIAENYGHAVARWTAVVASENDMAQEDVEPPQGVAHICEDCELLA